MFEEREIPMDALLGILAIEKLRYDNGVKIYGEILDIECFCESVSKVVRGCIKR